MELWEGMIPQILEEDGAQIGMRYRCDLRELTEAKCYATLARIRAVLDDPTLDDPSCFMKIEEIVRIFEEIGSDGGCRHDF